jgi:hypothetical protein
LNSTNNDQKGAGKKSEGIQIPLWLGVVIALTCCVIVVVLGMLVVSIMERRWEAQRPAMVHRPIDEWQTDNAVWG